MAVLTSINEADATEVLSAYGLGRLHALGGIAGGSVNSNFSLESEAGRFFLRLYEERDLAGARQETAMLERLARAGVPTPAPLRRIDGGLVSVSKGKPAALFPWRPGRMRCQAGVTAADAWRVGEALARVHVEGTGETCEPGRFGFGGLLLRLDRVAASDDANFRDLAFPLRAHLARIHAQRDPRLPRGLAHGDLFRDNALFDAGRLSAVFDYYFAGVDVLLFDIAVCANDWCLVDPDQDRNFDAALIAAFLADYGAVRPLTAAEREAWPTMLRAAALRFWLSRLHDFHLPRPGELVHAHDPEHFREILALRASPDFVAPWVG